MHIDILDLPIGWRRDENVIGRMLSRQIWTRHSISTQQQASIAPLYEAYWAYTVYTIHNTRDLSGQAKQWRRLFDVMGKASPTECDVLATKTKLEPDTSVTGHFGTGTEVSIGHFCHWTLRTQVYNRTTWKKYTELELRGRARRETALRRKSEWKVNLGIQNPSLSNDSWRMTT